MKEYFGNKSKEIEKKVHISDSIIFKNNELIQVGEKKLKFILIIGIK